MTPEQMRMARAALNWSLRDFGKMLDVSAAAISEWERGKEWKLSSETIDRAETIFNGQRVFFGPKNGVCMDQDVFKTDSFYAAGLFQLLVDAGHIPNSTELIAAGHRATSNA